MRSFLCILFIFQISAAATQLSIAIQPFEDIDTNQLLILIPLISKEYNNAAVKILSPLPLPENAFYKPRNRYRAEKLLQFLDSLNNGSYDRVVGLTKKDISTTKGEYDDWGIFGLGNLNGYSCVVSTFRLNSILYKIILRNKVWCHFIEYFRHFQKTICFCLHKITPTLIWIFIFPAYSVRIFLFSLGWQ